MCYAEGSPFESSQLSTPEFLTLLRPITMSLNLGNMLIPVDPDHFAAICELSNLEELSIGDYTVCPGFTILVCCREYAEHIELFWMVPLWVTLCQ